MSEIDEILSQVPMDQVAAALGVDQSEAEEATRTAIPALLGGMQANAADPAGAASLMSAVEQHDPSVLGSGLDRIDTQDGERIVQNVFGEQTPDVMARLGGATPGPGSSLIQKLLPIIAPIVMAYLAKKLQGAGGSTSAAVTDDPMGGLGGMLGGAGGSGGLGDVLGSVLGGGAASGAGSAGRRDRRHPRPGARRGGWRSDAARNPRRTGRSGRPARRRPRRTPGRRQALAPQRD